MSDERHADEQAEHLEQQLAATGTGEIMTAAPSLSDEEIAARHAAWWQERRERADALVNDSRRSWAAMQGWDAVKTQEEWDSLSDQAVEDWASGAMLIRMLGGERYLDPPRTALMQHLWHHFRSAYRPEGPAEFMAIAMALFAFHQLIRVNEFAGNMATRLEYQFFDTTPLQVRLVERDGTPKRAGQLAQIEAREALEQFGRDALPLMDRLNRMVLRNLRALRELKAAPMALTVQNVGQLNLGQVQTNVAKPLEADSAIPAAAERKPRQRHRK